MRISNEKTPQEFFFCGFNAGRYRLGGDGQAQTFTTLHSFTPVAGAFPTDGAFPIGGLLLSQGCVYGVTASGGNVTNGTVFKMNLDGTGFTNLYRFTTGGTDGAGPQGSLVLSGNTLYGTCATGGTGGNGLVFALNTDGTGFRTVWSFPKLPERFLDL